MKKVLFVFAIVAIVMCGFAHVAKAQAVKTPGAVEYTAMNDDVYSGYNGNFNSISIFKIEIYIGLESTKSHGLGGGYFGIPRVDIDVSSGGKCVFAADAGGVSGSGPADIASFNYPNLVGNFTSNYGGDGYLYGIGLAHAGNVLLAGWSSNNVLESYAIGSGCTLSKGSSVTISGGGIDGVSIAPNGKWYLTTTADGDYEVGSITGGVLGAPTAYSSTCASTYGALPTGTVIDPTSTYGYVDCLGGNAALIDAFNISSPGTETENGPLSALGGTAIYGSNTMGLSTDGKLMYVVGTFSGSVETASVSGLNVTDAGCSTGNLSLPGYGSQWIYPGTINALGTSVAARGGAIVTEAGFGLSGNNSFMITITIGKGGCLATGVQGTDPNSEFALSGASYLAP